MRSFFFFAVFLLLGYVSARTQPESIQKCEDVLSKPICDKLRKAAVALEQKEEAVDNIIREVVKSGFKHADEIIAKVEEKLVALAKKVPCDHLLPEKWCKKIFAAAEKLKIDYEVVEKFLKEVVAKGLTRVEDIMKEIIKKFFPTIAEVALLEIAEDGICEKVLEASVCAELRAIAERLHLHAELVAKLIQEALDARCNTTTEIIEFIRKRFVEMADEFHCQMILPKFICSRIEAIAKHIKGFIHVKEKIDQFLKEIVAKGIHTIHGLIKALLDKIFGIGQEGMAVTTEFMDTIKCEDVLSAEVCADLRKAAEKFKLKVEVIDKLIREAIEKKLSDAKKIIEEVRKRIVELAKDFHCTDVLSAEVCHTIDVIAKELKVKAEKVTAFIKALVAKGITKARDIIKHIIDRFFPHLQIEDLFPVEETTCEDVLAEKICKSLRDAAHRLKIKIEVVDELIRHCIKEKITDAKAIIAHIRKHLIDLATNFKCSDVLPEKVCTKIMEIAAKLKVNAAKVNKWLKEVVAKGITSITEIIHEILKHLFPSEENVDAMNIISKCEDVLSAKACATLREIAHKLKVEVGLIDKFVREAVKKGITKAKEIIAEVKAKIIAYAKNFKCENVLTANICKNLRKIAEKLKLEAKVIDELIRKAIAKGITDAKKLVAYIKAKIAELATKFKCENILSAAACKQLREAAKKLKINVAKIDKFIREAVAKGIKEAKDIIAHVQKKIVDFAKNFKCENALSAGICKKMREIAAKLKIKFAAIEKVIKEAIAKGISKAKEIIHKIIDHFFPHVPMTEFVSVISKCEDVLSATVCAKLREIAQKLKLDVALIDKFVREAVKKGITKAKEIIKEVKAKIIDLAKNFKCEDALPATACETLRKIAKKLKIDAELVDEFIRKAIASGITKAKEIIEKVEKKIIEFATNFKCENVLTAFMCKELREAAKKLKVEVELVDRVIRELVAKGVTEAKKIIAEVRKRIVDFASKFSCEDVLSANICAKIKKIAKDLKVKFEDVLKVIKECIAKGVKSAKAIIKKIIDHFFPHLTVEEFEVNPIVNKCEDVLPVDICAKMRELAKKLKVEVALIDKFIRDAVERGIVDVEALIKEVKAKIVDFATNFKCEDVLGKKVCDQLRNAAKQLKIKAEAIDKFIRQAVVNGITKAKEIIADVRKRIVDFATNFQCSDVLPKAACDKIKSIADRLKVKFSEIEKVIKEAVVRGITKIKDIIHKIIDHFFPHLTLEDLDLGAKKCEDLLSETICTGIRAIAQRLKVKVELVDQFIQEAAAKGITDVTKLIEYVREKLVEKATKFGCNDIMPQMICDKIKELAAKFSVSAEKIENFIKEIVSKGATSIHEIMRKIIDRFFPSVALSELDLGVKKCEDLLSATICNGIRAIAHRLKVKVEEVDKLIQEAAAKGITDAKAVIEYVREKLVHMATKFGCNDIMPQMICDKIKELAAKFKVSAEKVENFIKEIVSKGATSIHDIIKKIIDRFFPSVALSELDFVA